MNLIHRHIFANVVLTCAAAVGMFAFVLLLGNVLKDLLGHVLAGQLPIGTLVQLVALTIPVVVSYALPMGILTGVLLVLGRMSSDREVTALRASGLSVSWLSAPILFCALLGVVLNLAINFQFMPLAKVAYETELASAIRQNPLSFIVPKTFIRDFPGYVIYAGDKERFRAEGFLVVGTRRKTTRETDSFGPMRAGSNSTRRKTSSISHPGTRAGGSARRKGSGKFQ